MQVTLRSMVALACLSALVACEQPKKIGPKGTAKPAASKSKAAKTPNILMPADELKLAKTHLAVLNAQTLAWRGINKSFTRSLVFARTQLKNQQEEQGTAKPDLKDASVLTILFSANNHGEREDCGCRHNPLGGLDRRASLINYVKQPKSPNAIKYWGKDMPANEAVFVVDAGEALFKSISYQLDKKGVKDRVMKMAEGVIMGMNVSKPDVMAIGARELAVGVDGLMKLKAMAKFPMISANLADEQGKLLFAPSQVVERAGKKVAFIGLTRTRTRYAQFYKSKKLKLLDSQKAYADALAKLPADVDAVVLLSNDGMANSAKMIESFKQKKLRVDLAIVSGSNRLTKKPVWASGVPLVEPMSRGKYFGRVDMFQRAPVNRWQFANDTPDVFELLTDYSAAFKSYGQAQVGLLQDQEEQQFLKVQALGKMVSDKTPKDSHVKYFSDADQNKIAKLQKRMKMTQRRKDIFDKSTAKAINALKASVNAPKAKGEDWIDVRVVPVAISIPQDKAARKVLDKYKKVKWDEGELYR